MVKSLTYKIIIIVASFITVENAYAKSTILDYYNAIPVQLLDDQRYMLRFTDNKWIARSDASLKFEAVVDVKNGYINITDRGTGGGRIEQELALFRKASGSGIIGVNLITFDGAGYSCMLRFYNPADQWRDMTADILPEIHLLQFMDNIPSNKRNNGSINELTEGIVYLYKLPRIGTTIDVKLDMKRFILENRDESDNLKPEAMDIIKFIKYGEMQLVWDKNIARFRIGEMTIFSPAGELEKKYIKIQKQDDISSDQKQNPERKAILDSLRKRWPDCDVVFVVKYFRESKGWAWIHVAPQSHDGQSQFEDESWLLQKVNGRWNPVEARGSQTDCEEDLDCADEKRYYRKLKTKYQSVPEDIFPD